MCSGLFSSAVRENARSPDLNNFMDKSLLANATSPDDSPTPGYMLNDIAKSTLSNYQATVQLQEYLVSRLSKNNHNVKFKCLTIIKHVCRTGRAEFKKEMARNIEPIKECLQFRGPPDPLRGDEIYKRVRDVAKEALEAIYDSQMPVTTSAVAAGNRIQGMGNDYIPEDYQKNSNTGILTNIASSIQSSIYGDGTDITYTGHPGAGTGNSTITGSNNSNQNSNFSSNGHRNSVTSSSSNMTGFGNPNYKDPRDEKSWYEKAASTIGLPGVSVGNDKKSPYESYSSNRGPNALINNQNYNVSSDSSSHSPMTMNAFGANVNKSPWQQSFNQQSVSNNNPQTSPTPPGAKVVPEFNGSTSIRAGVANSDGGYERTMIESLCEPSGLKPTPNEEKLSQFLINSKTLSEGLVGSCLLDVLNSDAWQSRVKALIVISNLVSMKDYPNYYKWWSTRSDEVISLLKDSKSGVRTQAAKTLRAMGVSEETIASGSGVPSKTNSYNNNGKNTAKNDSISLLELDNNNNNNSNNNEYIERTSTSENINTIRSKSKSASEDFTEPSVENALFQGMSFGSIEAPTSQLSPVKPSAVILNSSIAVDSSSKIVAPMISYDEIIVSSPGTSNDKTTRTSTSVSTVTSLLDDLSFNPSATNNSSAFSFVNNNDNFTNTSQNTSSFQPATNSYANDFASLNLSQPVYATPPPPMNGMNMNMNNSGLRLTGPTVPMGVPYQVAPNNGFRPAPNGIYPSNTGQGQYPPQMQYQARPPMAIINTPAVGMLNPLAPRKDIPSLDGKGNPVNSGFGFIGGNGGISKTSSADDSFSFVSDAMKALKK
eukprot:gene6052-8333_t